MTRTHQHRGAGFDGDAVVGVPPELLVRASGRRPGVADPREQDADGCYLIRWRVTSQAFTKAIRCPNWIS